MKKSFKRPSSLVPAPPAARPAPPAPPVPAAAPAPPPIQRSTPAGSVTATILTASPAAVRLLAIVLTIGALYIARPVLLPFTVALILAIALGPLCQWMVRRGLSSTLASAVLAILALVILLGIAAVLADQIGRIVRARDRYIRALAGKVQATAQSLGLPSLILSSELEDEGPAGADQGERGAGQSGDATQRLTRWVRSIQWNTESVWRWATTGFGTLVEFLALIVLTIGYLFFMLKDLDLWGGRFLRAARAMGWRMEPHDLKAIQWDSIHILAWRALVNAAYVPLTAIGLTILRVPQPWLWGLLTGLLSFIPYFGVILSIIFPLLMALATPHGWWQPIGVIVLYTLLHVGEGHFVYPWLIGSRVRINPVLALLVTILWGWLWGPLGFLLGLSILVLVRDIVRVCPDSGVLAALLGVDER